MSELSAEEWRRVPDFPDYSVSSLGRVMSHKRETPQIMRTPQNNVGYRHVVVRNADGKYTYKVHCMVAAAFYGPRPEGAVIRHLDGDKTNNAVSNLTYGTHRENQLDAIKHGAHGSAKRTRCPKGHTFDLANTYWYGSTRHCRACGRETQQAIRDKRAANDAWLGRTS